MMLSDVMEDYLKAIYRLQEDGGDPIRTSEIAEYLDVTSPTVTSMVEKLSERGLVDREKYKGVRLTPEGETVALEVLRHHRLLETYLTEHLDYDWSEVHDEADRLEHYISEKFERRVAELLDDPDVDPHGDPIPGVELEPPPVVEGTPLSDVDPGETVRVERIADDDAEVLEYLAERGIEPGATLAVADVAPFGMVTLEPVGGSESAALPEDVAREVGVSVVSPIES